MKFSHQNVGRQVQLRQRQWDEDVALLNGLDGAGEDRLWARSLPAGQGWPHLNGFLGNP